MNVFLRGIVIALSLLGGAAIAVGQRASPSTDPASAPNLELNAAQKQTIYTSARNLNIKNETPPNFQPIVGAIVPNEIRLEPMPDSIVQLAPRVKGFQIAVIANQVVLVEPQGRRVAEVIAGERH